MNRRGVVWAAGLALVVLLMGTQVSAAPQPGRIVFTAVGDLGARTESGTVLDAIAASDSEFTMTLGDMSYGTTGDELAWCDFVTSRVGAGYPFELLSGNHESNGINGNINDFSACLPNQLPGAVGTYGRQFYVDVPAEDPIARFIGITPGLTFPNGENAYTPGSARYLWTAQAIDTARSAGIPWVVVSMHKPCLTVGRYACDSGADVFDLLLTKKVDLILSGHEHSYQRSHQLGLGANCPDVVPGQYNADCVVDSDSTFTQGRGSVAMVVGTGGINPYDVTATDAEAPYFAKFNGNNTGAAYGALQVSATDTSLQGSFLRASGSSLTDSFTISRNTTPNTPPTAAFSPTCTALTCTFNASASSDSDGTIAGYAWNFGDGNTGTGATSSHTYTSAGSFTVSLTVTDDGGATATTTRNVTTTAPPVTPLVSDQFTRTVASGWGTAPTGGAWSVSSSTNTSVGSGFGNLVVPKGITTSANLASVSAPGADVVGTFTLDKATSGSGLYVSTHVRRTSAGSYLAKLKIPASGSLTLEIDRAPVSGGDVVLQSSVAVPGLAYAVGDTLNVRVQAVGTAPTVLSAKVWKAGTQEPTTWLRSVTDNTAGLQTAGSVGLSAYLSSGATTTSVTVKWDDLIVTAP